MTDRNFGLNYRLTPGQPVAPQVQQALQQFNQSPYGGQAGLIAVHVSFHPRSAPAQWEIAGLLVQVDDTIYPGFMRLSTCTFTQEFLEERRYIGQRITREASNAASV